MCIYFSLGVRYDFHNFIKLWGRRVGIRAFNREAALMLFQIISDSFERRSEIINTNLEFSRWVGIFYDEQMTAAMKDQLEHHSYLLLF